jgi:hypothetical protein
VEELIELFTSTSNIPSIFVAYSTVVLFLSIFFSNQQIESNRLLILQLEDSIDENISIGTKTKGIATVNSIL